jgi:signal transduction histidine kinase
MHRLYHRIFASLTAFVLIAIGLSVLASHLLLSDLFRAHLRPHLQSLAASFAAKLPPVSGSPDDLQAAVERLAGAWPLDLAVWGADGRRLAFTNSSLPAPPTRGHDSEWLESPSGPALAVPLRDGRWLVMQPHHFPRPRRFLFAVLALAALLAAASYPVARLVTRRLEGLQAGVKRLGEGDLAARVEVVGDDELAGLAASFNQSAERLQGLVEGQRRMLASGSHELRSPLARLRMALELAKEDPPRAGERLAEATAEVEELDALIEELLLAGRLELESSVPGEPVNVAALLREETMRIGATARGSEAVMRADPRLLRVLVRNLLENACRHGGEPIEAGVEVVAGGPPGVRLWVADRGPGVPERERDRIFEPFYRPPGHRETVDGGVGLGLYLVRRIAERYGGAASCRAREGGGTVFEVVLRDAPVPGADLVYHEP